MPTFYENLRKDGLGHYVPPSYKQRSYASRSRSSYAQYVPQETVRQKQARYGVWDEYRGRPADHIEPYSAARMKAQHTHAMNVFSKAIAQLEQLYWSGQ